MIKLDGGLNKKQYCLKILKNSLLINIIFNDFKTSIFVFFAYYSLIIKKN